MKCILALMLMVASLNAAAEEREVFAKLLKPDSNLYDLFEIDGSAPPRQITHDGVPKSLPVWSNDGSLIAYLHITDESVAFAELVVVDRNGKQISRMLINPAASASPMGMTNFDTIEWLSKTLIAVSGSVNPGIEQTLVFDISTKKLMNSILDESSDGPSFSPGGKHFSYISGMPPMAPESEWRPELSIDFVKVFPKYNQRVSFLSGSKWSLDGKSVAVVYKDPGSKMARLAVWRTDGAITTKPLSVSNDRPIVLVPIDGGFAVDDGVAGSTILGAGTTVTQSSSTVATDNIKQASLARARVEQQAKSFGGVEGNEWCSDCGDAGLPRRASLRD